MVNLFWLITVFCVLLALLFVMPPIWLPIKQTRLPVPRQYLLSFGLLLALPVLAYTIYGNLGAAPQLNAYYSLASSKARSNNRQIRPVYARLQREFVKSQLNLAVDPKNIDLIINFATVHSKISNGILQPEVQKLLESILNSWPKQITVLNLLAVNAYKQESYPQAISYWQQILAQFTPEMRNSEAEKIITSKIAETKIKQDLFESRRTK